VTIFAVPNALCDCPAIKRRVSGSAIGSFPLNRGGATTSFVVPMLRILSRSAGQR
jgi:hypothetical protein